MLAPAPEKNSHFQICYLIDITSPFKEGHGYATSKDIMSCDPKIQVFSEFWFYASGLGLLLPFSITSNHFAATGSDEI